MYLSDYSIKAYVGNGLVIDPFTEEHVGPASYDLTLAPQIILPPSPHAFDIDLAKFVLRPGDFILASTVERVIIPADLLGVVHGRSSLGRLGVMVHVTAGFVDPGFRGTLTLEIKNVSREAFNLAPGMRIAQIAFARLDTPVSRPYAGRYQDQDGVTVSRL